MSIDISHLDSLVGMEKPKQLLVEAATVSQHDGTKFPHILIIGNSGCGKTTLSKAIANMVGCNLREYHGRVLSEDKQVLMRLKILIRNLNPDVKALLFIDEIHQLKTQHQEMFFPLMEKPNFILIGATTDPGKLVKPFQNRFGLTIMTSDYTFEESKEIIVRYCISNNIEIDDIAINEIAKRGRGIPRTIQKYIDNCFNKSKFLAIQNSNSDIKITKEVAQITFDDLEIQENGLTTHEDKIIRILQKHNQLAVKTLCSMAEIDNDQFEKEYEPYLIKLGLIEKHPRGRKITDIGIAYANSINPEYEEW